MAARSEWLGATASNDSSLELAPLCCLAVTAVAQELGSPGQGPGYTLCAAPGAKPSPRASTGSGRSSTPGCHLWSRQVPLPGTGWR